VENRRFRRIRQIHKFLSLYPIRGMQRPFTLVDNAARKFARGTFVRRAFAVPGGGNANREQQRQIKTMAGKTEKTSPIVNQATPTDTTTEESSEKTVQLAHYWFVFNPDRPEVLPHRRRSAKYPSRPSALTTPRPCMTCRKTFDSEGPYNRMCDRCRKWAAEVSPLEPDPGGALPDVA